MRGLALDDVRAPVEEAVLVLDEVRERAEERVGLEAMSARLLLGVPAQEKTEQREEGENRRSRRSWRARGEVRESSMPIWIWLRLASGAGDSRPRIPRFMLPARELD